ncbi:hypothetical protein LBMAG27_07470 [Bacteroidota bacterium]|nr:hypothetical protein LBMAG27_07470 [Bacteroidota bacterium]
MITKHDLEALNALTGNKTEVKEPLFIHEAVESLTELALEHFPMLRVIDSEKMMQLEEKISLLSAELEVELAAMSGETVE